MNWRVSPEIAGAGHFFDLASHQFDYLDFLLGKVTDVTGYAANMGGLYAAEDTLSASWQHETGVLGSGRWSFVVGRGCERDEIVIVGEKGKIALSCFAEPDRLWKVTAEGESELRFENPQHISQHLVRQVVDELRGVGECVSTGESAARTSRVLEQVVKEYYSDQA